MRNDRALRYFIVILVLGFVSPLAFGEGERPDSSTIALSSAIEATEYFAPFVPAMSSLSYRHPLRFLGSPAAGYGFTLTWWYFSATPYLYFEPFVEIGTLISYVDLRATRRYLAAGAGLALEYFDLQFSVPATVVAEWYHELWSSGVWAGVKGQALFWSDGVGIELAAPVQLQRFYRVYGSLAPQAIAYFVDDRINLNLRTVLTVGVRLGGRDHE